MMKYVLRPFGLGSESLKPFIIDPNVPQTFVLGRNIETGLDKAGVNVNHVSRNHVSVTVRDGKIMMSPIARQDLIVSFNGSACQRGEHEMAVDDEFSLLGSIHFFNYRLEKHNPHESYNNNSSSATRKRSRVSEEAEVVDVDAPLVKRLSSRGTAEVLEIDLTTPNAKVTGSLTIPSGSVKEEVVEVIPNSNNNINNDKQSESAKAEAAAAARAIENAKVLREFECAICYETMASVCTLVPCGDNFCFACIADWSAKSKACPLCQGPFDLNNCVSNKLLDNVIRSTLQTAGEDVSAWEKRVSEGIEQRKRFLGAPVETNNKQAPQVAIAPPPLRPFGFFPAPAPAPAAPVPVSVAALPQAMPAMFVPSSSVMGSARQQPTARRRRGGQSNAPSFVDLT